ncbi:precorrin-6y C5,15-methyltransferase (decarboxylating) subunit CbiE [Thermosipho globiformans]|uniref:precorrin-6y C5,15-methyltransferase (decarboxylating) subunit CbiE n=1 Tax=Thermosipho globiformans TaxID=380685 RepID=UPI000F8EFF7E|nr:precorrin-6y C5,15-methyltransferase (decarboxylating) subunit CbiE [Thermosipho globiformans]
MITVVGVGPGNPKLLTSYALEKIKEAKVLVGGKRLLEQFDTKAKKIPYGKNFDLKNIDKLGDSIVVLASGDPLLYGIANTLLKNFREKVEIIPGISCVQYMASKLKVSLNDAKVVSFHGRKEKLEEILNYKKIFIFTDKVNTPQKIAKDLRKASCTDYVIFVGENLSYENEKIYRFTLRELAEYEYEFGINLVLLLGE